MGFPATKSSVSQIIEKLDSLPNSARDTAVNNSIVPSDNLAGLGESVLKLYSESSPSAREAIAEMFELASTNRSTIGLTGSNASAMDSPSKESAFGNSIRFPKRLPMPSIRKDGPSPTMTYAISDIWKSSGKQTLPVTISYLPSTCAAKIWTLPAIGCLQSAISSTAGIRSRRRLSPLDARTLPRSIESSKTSNLPMRAQSPVSKLSAKLSPAHGMRKLRRKTSIRNRSTIFANEQALPSMTRWMILARLGAARISISSQRPAGECCSPIAR